MFAKRALEVVLRSLQMVLGRSVWRHAKSAYARLQSLHRATHHGAAIGRTLAGRSRSTPADAAKSIESHGKWRAPRGRDRTRRVGGPLRPAAHFLRSTETALALHIELSASASLLRGATMPSWGSRVRRNRP